MSQSTSKITGLSAEEVKRSREQHGSNVLDFKEKSGLLQALLAVAKEPMVLLLLVASSIYFISGQTGEGVFMVSAVLLVAAISGYQDSRSRNALEKLKEFTQPLCKVIRNGETKEIPSEDLVIGDALIAEEGTALVADGTIIQSNDFSINESILTGESLSVFKDASHSDPTLYKGTTVASGLAIVTVTAIGNNTKLGKIGKSLEAIQEEATPLELQINNFVKKMVIAGTVVFLVVWAINYSMSKSILDSLLKALTLAMSILPEEIPVAFTTFMALGAWRLMKKGIVVKQMKTVETLGSATVICTDKTGTITENKMSLVQLFVLSNQKLYNYKETLEAEAVSLIELAMWSSEPIPFDPMEIALHTAYAEITSKDKRPSYQMVHEYPLSGQPPMMTHIFGKSDGTRIIAAKGAPEALISVSGLTESEQNEINEALKVMASEGYRVLGVGQAQFEGHDFPATQQEFKFAFKGLVAFYDPPKKGIQKVLQTFYKAGINVKIITGDNELTTAAIAKEIGLVGNEKSISGDALMTMDETQLNEIVLKTNVFTRMFPEAKLRIINALKSQNQIVAMTGDGVNDGPALKAAHIGIAMGKKGTEIAKQSASLILVNDDLRKMADAVAIGRKIYTNLKKAIQYIISIHIPIVLTVFLPLALGWIYPNIFTPVHIIFLELIMGPTCSIIYENEPIEKNTMSQKPRELSSTFFNWTELTMSMLQGLAITAGTLSAYQLAVAQGFDEAATRTMVFCVLISANIFLTLTNRSLYYSLLKTLRYKNNLVPMIIGITLLITGLLIFVPPLARFFQFTPLGPYPLLQALGIGFVSVIWFEGYKWVKRWK